MGSVDVAIAGAGLVGAGLALALAKQCPDYQIALIDAKGHPAELTDPRKLALSYGSQRIFQGLGVWSPLISQAVPIERVHVSEKGCFGATRFSAAEFALPALGYVVAAADLLATIHQQLSTYPNIQRHWGCPVSAVTAGHVTLPTGQLRSRLIIAADGTQSTLRDLVGIPVQRYDYKTSALLTYLTLANDHNNTAYERFYAGGVLALLPIAKQQVVLIWTVPTTQLAALLALPEATFLAQVQQAFGYRLGKFLTSSKRHSFPLASVTAEQAYQQGVLLLGNAAHTVNPIAAQGFNLALRDLAALVQVIGTAKQQTNQEIVERYLAWRAQEQRQIMRLTHQLVRLFASETPALRLVRSFGMVLFDTAPLAKRWLAKQTLGLSGKLPDLQR